MSGGKLVEWVATTPAAAHTLRNRAVAAGLEGHDGSPLWVIRATFREELLPGKLAVEHNAAYVPWGGKEHAVENIEVCCANLTLVDWIKDSNGNVPPSAIMAGSTKSGEPLYVGRAFEQGALTPGKIHQSEGVLYISFNGVELKHQNYEVLCLASS